MKKPLFLPWFLLIPLALSGISCSARIEGLFREDGSAGLSLEASLEPRTAALIRSLAALSGPPASGAVIDGPSIARSMAAAPGVAAVTLENLDPRTVAGNVAISRVDAFLVPGEDPGGGRFISYEPSPPDGGRLVIRLDRQRAPGLLALLSEEAAAYLGALMAPAATGEALGKAEYLGLVASVYGRPVADEISSARITLSIEFPRPPGTVRGGTIRDNRALFNLPLVDFLVLETPLEYEVSW
jgi:hypothetical protein